ncbi:MAG: CHASE4 domain-containing protein, partial [Sphingomonadaceae bacterium]|nr:CHASE4 domain-containing protein [Sphingomonadaceae bacterium]
MNFGKLFHAPMALIVAAALATLGLGLIWLTELQDGLEQEREVQLTASAVNDHVERMRTFVREYSFWDEAVRRLALDLDSDWADENVGVYAYNLNRFEYVLVVTPADEAVYAVVDGKHAPVDPAVALGGGYVSAARQLVRAEAAGAQREIAGITQTGRGPAVFGIARIRPSSNEVQMPGDLKRYLVAAKLIDP